MTPERRTVAGIDFSTKETWIVRRTPGLEPTVRRITLPKMSHLAEQDAYAAREVALSVQQDTAFWDDVWLAGIEYPFTMSFRATILKTILGALVASIPAHVHVLPLPARLWQPWFLRTDPAGPLPTLPRKGVDRKPLIAARARALLQTDGFTQDAYDAFGVAWAAEEFNRVGQIPPTPPRPTAKRAA